MTTVPTALYLDFDNVFSGLMRVDPQRAMWFAQAPSYWLDRLTTEYLNDGPRRWLVLRCYVNPGGSLIGPDGDRVYFSSFRTTFTDAGFEVIDCPRLTHTKNGADIRLALDAAESLRGEVRYAEFVIASGDSDMTPLLVRLRAADRRLTVVSPADAARVLGSIADRFIGSDEVVELIDDPERGVTDDEEASAKDRGPDTPEERKARQRFAELVRRSYATATAPLNLGTLANRVRAELALDEGNRAWFGHSGFGEAVRRLELPGAVISSHYLWDPSRHDEPAAPAAGVSELPGVVARVTAELRLPRLQARVWPRIYDGLAKDVSEHEFALSNTSKSVRDTLASHGVVVPRSAVTLVTRGASYGGRPLYENPPPTAAQIGEAFVGNLVERARAADVILQPDDETLLRRWFAGRASGG